MVCSVDAGKFASVHGNGSNEQVPPELMEMLKKAAREQQEKLKQEAASITDAGAVATACLLPCQHTMD
eukprot:COSAG01_NODE_3611_length_5872_cov_7.051793_5_plen_68_part_00